MPTNLLRKPFAAAAASALCVTMLAAGCSTRTRTAAVPTGSSGNAATPPTSATPGASDTPSTAPAAGSANKWFPLQPGSQLVREGRLNRGHRKLEHRRVSTVTGVTKMIDGVRAVLVLDQDFDGGEVAEQALDYFAVDAQGNVVYLGSYTEAYEGGQFVNVNDAWLSGVKRAARGTLVPGDPKAGVTFTQADIPGRGKETAKVVETGRSVCVPFKCYTDVLVIREGDEYKYFAPGVGDIKTEPHYSGGEQEIEELVNVIRLSPPGLADLDKEALRLDNHARETAKSVFGDSQSAEAAR